MTLDGKETTLKYFGMSHRSSSAIFREEFIEDHSLETGHDATWKCCQLRVRDILLLSIFVPSVFFFNKIYVLAPFFEIDHAAATLKWFAEAGVGVEYSLTPDLNFWSNLQL